MDARIPIQFIPPEALEGTNGVVWLARDGRRTTTQVATQVRYTMRLTPNRANALGQTAILPPTWEVALSVARKDSYLQGGAEVVLTLDDGRQALGFLSALAGVRTIRATLRVAGWLEAWQ